MSATPIPDAYRNGSFLRRGGHWARSRDVANFMMWFEYLKLSPSYELARRVRTGELSDADSSALPADIEAVLAIYDDLGDVREVSFDQWWLETAIPHFGYQGQKPNVTHLGTLRHDARDPAGMLRTKAGAFVDDVWIKQGGQQTLILAIPVGLPKAQIAKQVAALVEKAPKPNSSAAIRPPKYQLVHRKMDRDSLFKYLMCVWLRATAPNLALWRIGVRAKVSSTYSGRLDPAAKLDRHQQPDDRNALKILTSRAIHRGHMMAENAARGIFPSYAKCAEALPLDLAQIDKLRRARRRRELAEQRSANE